VTAVADGVGTADTIETDGKQKDPNARAFLNLCVLQVLSKGFNVFYFVLLTVFYADHLITSEQLGYIGAIFIGLLIVGAVFVARWFHSLSTKRLLQLASWVSIISTALLFVGAVQKSLAIIIVSYAVMGLCVGIAMSGVNAVAAGLTKKGERFKSLAHLAMLTDIARMVFPVLVAGMVSLGQSNAAVVLIMVAAGIFFLFSSGLPASIHGPDGKAADHVDQVDDIRTNKAFLFVLSMEFFDSFSSSQLFVFLPILFLAKGFSLENSLVLQSFIFVGYLSGRAFVTNLAKRYDGMRAIAYTEIGMVVCIVALLTATQQWALYLLTFALGIFSRGTSPAIKALAFDTLEDHQVKKGSALHVVGGDSGSAAGQLLFGILVAAVGVHMPFVVGAVIAGVVGVAALVNPLQVAVRPKGKYFTVLASGPVMRAGPPPAWPGADPAPAGGHPNSADVTGRLGALDERPPAAPPRRKPGPAVPPSRGPVPPSPAWSPPPPPPDAGWPYDPMPPSEWADAHPTTPRPPRPPDPAAARPTGPNPRVPARQAPVHTNQPRPAADMGPAGPRPSAFPPSGRPPSAAPAAARASGGEPHRRPPAHYGSPPRPAHPGSASAGASPPPPAQRRPVPRSGAAPPPPPPQEPTATATASRTVVPRPDRRSNGSQPVVPPAARYRSDPTPLMPGSRPGDTARCSARTGPPTPAPRGDGDDRVVPAEGRPPSPGHPACPIPSVHPPTKGTP
jgi:MFS family permease